GPPIVAADADDPNDPRENSEAFNNISWRQALTAQWPPQTVWPCCSELVFVAGKQSLRIVGLGHAAAPHGKDLVIRQLEIHIRLPASRSDEPASLLKTVPKRCARQSLKQINGRHRNLCLFEKVENARPGVLRIRVEAKNYSRNDLHSVLV